MGPPDAALTWLEAQAFERFFSEAQTELRLDGLGIRKIVEIPPGIKAVLCVPQAYARGSFHQRQPFEKPGSDRRVSNTSRSELGSE